MLTKTSMTSHLVMLLVVAASATAGAQPRKTTTTTTTTTTSAQAAQGDKMDVSDLEKKYWAAKDTDFNVVQNRLFSKANRLGLTLNYGMFVSDPWSKGGTYGAAVSYYFSERSGVELAYSQTNSVDNDATTTLKAQGGAPNHTKLKGYYGLGYNWVPFYAKMSVLNSSIVYFDMSVTPGIGMVQYEQQKEEGNAMQNTAAFSLSLTQHYFLTKWVALRLDYRNFWYNENMVSYRIGSRNLNTTGIKNDSLLMGGFTFYF